MPTVDDVDLFHAVDGGGNCLPGPCVPFGQVRLGPDMINHNTSGYATGEDLRHFSHIHVAGTGGSGRYGCIGIVPTGQRPDTRQIGYAVSDETASPGYYAVSLRPRQGFGELANLGVTRCQLTATHRTGLHHYQWDDSLDPWIRIDLGACIGGKSIGGWARWINARTLVCRADYAGGWGHALSYSVFARIEVDGDLERQALTSDHQIAPTPAAVAGPGILAMGRVANGRELQVRVGISFTSVADAQRNLEREQAGRDFASVRNQAHVAWSALLDRFQVSGGRAADRQLWATMWARLYTMPDRFEANEVPWFACESPHFNNLYCLWDSVRCANSLFGLVDPSFEAELCQSLIETGEQTGWIPDAWIMGGSASIQGGCSAAVLFAEAVRKQLPGFDAERALAALSRTQETPSPDPVRYGRFPDWATRGYLPLGTKNCVSRAVEYAFHDRCTAVLAAAANADDQAEQLTTRAAGIWDSWHPEQRCFAPRDEHGDWVAFDPWRPTRRDFWSDPHFYEGTGYDYALTLWTEIPALVERHGGPEAFSAHLDAFLENAYIWKEINLHVPWLYHFVGQPHRSSQALHRLMDAHLRTGRDGMGDNEDMGAWSSWWLTGAMGLGPVPGSDLYLLGTPRFATITVQIPGASAPLTITCDHEPTANDVITGATLNGQPLTRAWVRHADISNGATIHYHLGAKPSTWGTTDLPTW